MPPMIAIAVTSTSPHCSGMTAGRRGAIVLRLRRRHMPQTVRMEDAFGIVIFVVVGVAAVVAVGTFFTSGKAYDQIGKGGLSLRDGPARAGVAPRAARGAAAVRGGCDRRARGRDPPDPRGPQRPARAPRRGADRRRGRARRTD